MKLIKLILTSIVIVAYVQGCYKLIKHGIRELDNISEFKKATIDMDVANPNTNNEISTNILDGTMSYTFDGMSYIKPYLFYISQCTDTKKPQAVCDYVFLSFDSKFEKISMQIQFEGECNNKDFLELLSNQGDCLYKEEFKVIPLRLKGKTESENLTFIYHMERLKFEHVARISGSYYTAATKNFFPTVPNRTTNNDQTEDVKCLQRKQRAACKERKLIDFEVYQFDNYLAIQRSTETVTFPLDNNNCVRKFVTFAKKYTSTCNEKNEFGFYSYVQDPSNDNINPSKEIDSLIPGTIKEIKFMKITETIRGQKPKILNYTYALFKEEPRDFGTRFTLKLENGDQKTVRIYYFNFTNPQCILRLKYLFHIQVPCTDEALLAQKIVLTSQESNDKVKFVLSGRVGNSLQIKMENNGRIIVSKLSEPLLMTPQNTQPANYILDNKIMLEEVKEKQYYTEEESGIIQTEQLPNYFYQDVKTTTVKGEGNSG
jgi:hypothetical protein